MGEDHCKWRKTCCALGLFSQLHTYRTRHLSLVTLLFLPESSPSLAGLFRSKVLGKTGRRHGEDSAKIKEEVWNQNSAHLYEYTYISPEGVEYSPGRSPGFLGLRNRRNILAPAHTFERERSKVWAGAFYEDVCLCRVPQDCVLGYIQRPPLRSGLPGCLGTFCSFSHRLLRRNDGEQQRIILVDHGNKPTREKP